MYEVKLESKDIVVVFMLSSGKSILIFDPLHLLAVKIEAFQDRGVKDPYTSRDIQDIFTILDGCSGIFELLGEQGDIQRFILGWVTSQRSSELIDLLGIGGGDDARAEHLVERLHELAARLS